MVSEKRQSASDGPGGLTVVVVVVLMLLVVPVVVLIGVGGLVFVGIRSRAITTMPTATPIPVAAKAATPTTELALVVKQDGTILLEGAEVTLDELPAKVNEYQASAVGGVHVGVAANPVSPPDKVQQVFNKLGETGASYFIRPPRPDEVEEAATVDGPAAGGEQSAEPGENTTEPTPEANDRSPEEASPEDSP